MKKKLLLPLLSLLCLPSCGSTLLSNDYKPKADLPYVSRNGDAYINQESGYAVLQCDVSVSEAVSRASKTGETLIFYFYSSTCHFCEEVRAGFAEFLEDTDVKVLSYTYYSEPNYFTAVKQFEAITKESAEAFFDDWGTPLLFSYKDGVFSKIPLYGNHGSAKAVAKMMDGLYSFPYLYEFSTWEACESFLDKGYPIYLLDEGDSLPDVLKTNIQQSSKPFGYLFKSSLEEEGLKKLEASYGSASLLIDGKAIEKEDCSSYIEDYFA